MEVSLKVARLKVFLNRHNIPIRKRLIDAIPDIHQTRPPRPLNNDILLKFDRVSVDYTSPSGSLYRAVNDINLAIRKGETLGIVGESGSGNRH